MGMRVLGVAVLVMGLAASSASAGFVKIDDFENYAADSAINGQGSWTGSGSANAATVRVDPDGSVNKVLEVQRQGYADRGAYNTLGANGIADGATGTVFFRMRRAGTASFSMGLTDTAINCDKDSQQGLLETRFSGSKVYSSGLTTSGTLGSDTWVRYWLYVDNNNDTFSLYQEGNDMAVQTLLHGFDPWMNDKGAVFAFQNGTAANSLDYFAASVGQWGNPDTMYLDDIYVDLAGLNLGDPLFVARPVAEPAGLGLLGLALLGVKRKRS